MINRDTFTRWWQAVRPRWTTGYYGERFFGLLALYGDLIAEAARQSVRHRYPTDETPFVEVVNTGEDRGVPYYPNEAPLLYRKRVLDHWEQHRLACTQAGIEAQFRSAGYDAELDILTPIKGLHKYRVVLKRLGDRPCRAREWGDGSVWDDGGSWDNTLTATESRTLKGILNRYAPAKAAFEGFRCLEAEDALPGLDIQWRADTGLVDSDGNWIGWDSRLGGETMSNVGSSITVNVSNSTFGGQQTLVLDPGYTWTSTLSNSGSTAGTIYIVARAPKVGSSQSPFTPVGAADGAQIDNISWRISNTDPQWGARMGADAVINSAQQGGSYDVINQYSGKPVLLVAVRDGTSVTLYRDGIPSGSFTLSSGGTGFTGSLRFATDALSKGFSDFEIAEVGIWEQAATADQVDALAQYCADRYAIDYGWDPIIHPYA